MPFRVDRATTTLHAALHALAEAWPALDPVTQRRVFAVMQRYSRDVVLGNSGMWANAMIGFLQGLWDLSEVLPGEVAQALAAGQGFTSRPVLTVDEASRQALAASILRVADPRFYQDPVRLARAISDLVAVAQDRLTEAERAAWQPLDTAYRADRAGLAERYLRQVERLLGHYAAVGERLEAGKAWSVMAAGAAAMTGRAREGVIDLAGSAELPLRRYASVRFPGMVLLAQQCVPLIVHATVDYNPAGSVGAAATLRAQAGELTMVLHADDFSVATAIGGRAVAGNPAARTVDALPDRDCEPVIFFVTPGTPGEKRLSVDVYQAERLVASISFGAAVVDQAQARELDSVQPPPALLASFGRAARPPDLELRVTLSGEGRTLAYTLHSPQGGGYNFKPAGRVRLQTEPRDFLQRYAERLSALARTPPELRRPADSEAALRELGANIYEQLFPRELKLEYLTLRERFRGRSLLIISDEPWIPWELVRPYACDAGGVVLYDDPFLCETFQLSRWLAGCRLPDRLVFRQAAVVTTARDLAAAQQETDYFVQLYRQEWGIQLQGPLTTLAEVASCLDGAQTQLYHFACHGNLEVEHPDASRLTLAGGALQPSMLAGHTASSLRRARPLIFLNAGSAGDVGFSPTRLGGWAERLLASGVTAMIGPSWQIDDRLAAQFAVEFYNLLLGSGGQPGLPLGQAVAGARQAIRQSAPANPSWLAYVLYGDPYGDIAPEKC